MHFITVRLHKGVTMTAGAARTLTVYALRRFGREDWGLTTVELFSGGGETLAIARPSAGLEFYVADYALPILGNYFTQY